MTYEADFKSKRKDCVTAVDKLKPSSSLVAFLNEEKMANQIKAIDTAGDDSGKLTTAHGDAEKYLKLWLNKVREQIKKERVDQKVLGKAFDGLEDDVKKLLDDAGAKLKRLEKAESVSQTGKDVAASMAEAVNLKNLKRALADFEERRKTHLNAVEKMAEEAIKAGPEIRGLHQAAAKAVGEALGNAKLGRLNEARKVADLALKCAGEAEKLASSLHDAYNERIKDAFQKDRNLGFPHYVNDHDFDLKEHQKPAFLKAQIGISAIFTKAQHLGKQTLSTITDYDLLAQETRAAAEQADQAAKMKDIRPIVLKSLEEALKKVKEIEKSIKEQIDTETNSGLTSSTESYLEDWKTESKRPDLRDSMPQKVTGWKAKINALEGEVETLEKATKSQIARLPKDLSSVTEFKNLSMQLLQITILTKRAVTEFSKKGEKYITQMEDLINS